MNVSRHAAVLWRFRLITATGLFLGIFLAVFASYKISFDGAPSLQARSGATFGSDATLLVTQPGFPEGRVTLPQTPTADASQVDGTLAPLPKDRIEYAEPGRFGALADLYSQIAMSDRVRGTIPEKPKSDQITAFALEGASGGVILPVIKLTVTTDTKEGAKTLSEHTIKALRDVLKADQQQAKIPANSRVELRTLNESTKGYIVKGPSRTASILVLVLTILGTIGLTHLLAALRDRDEDPSIDGIVDPWAPETNGNGNGAHPQPAVPRHAPEPASVGWSGGPSHSPAGWSASPPPAPSAPHRRGIPGRRNEQ
jgi:hypothetical protein